MAAVLLPNGKQDYQTATGEPLVGGKLRTFDAGTNNPRPTFLDAAANDPNTNPVILDGRGEAVIFWRGAYKVELLDANDVVIWTVDGIQGIDVNEAVDIAFDELANTTDPAKGDAMIGVKQPYPGATPRTQHDKNAESLSLLDFIPPNLHAAIRDYTSTTDVTPHIVLAIAACRGRRLFVPSGRYSHTAIIVPPAQSPLYIYGEAADYELLTGSIFLFTGTGLGFQFGVDNGDPDTNPAWWFRSLELENICFKTLTGASNIKVQSAVYSRIENCAFDGSTSKAIELSMTVTTKVLNNLIRGTYAGSNYGLYINYQYAGSLVTHIENNWFLQLNWGIRAAGGRDLVIERNIFEVLRAGGIVQFGDSGWITAVYFCKNYSERAEGLVFDASTFSGLIQSLTFRDNELLGAAGLSSPAAVPNPGFGNLNKANVGNSDISGNLILDAATNTAFSIGSPIVYPSTNLFTPASTVVLAPVTNKDYEQDLRYALPPFEMLKEAGTFCSLDSATVTTATGGALSISGPNAQPTGWLLNSAPGWQLIIQSVTGSWVCTATSAVVENQIYRNIPLTPTAATRFFVLAITFKGRVRILIPQSSPSFIYDTGAATTVYRTDVARFTLPANAATFTFAIGSLTTDQLYIAEIRLWEIGSGDWNAPGNMNNALAKACRSLMLRGAY